MMENGGNESGELDMNVMDTNTNGLVTLEYTYKNLAKCVKHLTITCHDLAKAAGWWDKERPVAECLCLIHSEISEALEGYRTDKIDDHLSNHQSLTVELADAMIRICDLAGGLDLPLGEALAEKLCYNQIRNDHKRENRAKPGGKRI